MPRRAKPPARCGRLAGWTMAATLLTSLAAPAARAAPVEGKGTATIDEKSGISGARKRALGQARRVALDAALGGIAGPVDKAAKKAVRKRSEAWTGAYRILEQSDDGKTMTVRVEVDIDTVRLAKRVSPAKAKVTASQYTLGKVEVAPECAPVDTAWVSEELAAIEPAVVVLSVDADMNAKQLGRQLEALRLPGFSVTIASLSNPDVLTIRLH